MIFDLATNVHEQGIESRVDVLWLRSILQFVSSD